MDVFHQANNEAKKRQQLTESKGTESLASSFVCCSRQAGCPWGLVFAALFSLFLTTMPTLRLPVLE